MHQDLNRRLNMMELRADILTCLWYIFQEKNEIFSRRNASKYFMVWLAAQGYNFWVKKLNYKFDAHLWSTVFQESFPRRRLNCEFTNLTVITIPYKFQKFKSNYNELCHFSKILQRMNEIYFKQTKEFQTKTRIVCYSTNCIYKKKKFARLFVNICHMS